MNSASPPVPVRATAQSTSPWSWHPALPWAPTFTRACSQQRTPGLHVLLGRGTSPGGAKTLLPSTHHSCQSLVIQPVPISLFSFRSITPYPHLLSQFLLLVCPLSAFFAISHLLPASLRLPKSQGFVAWHHFTHPEIGSPGLRMAWACFGHQWLVRATCPGFQPATGTAELQYPLLLLNKSLAGFGEASARQLSRTLKSLKKKISKKNTSKKITCISKIKCICLSIKPRSLGHALKPFRLQKQDCSHAHWLSRSQISSKLVVKIHTGVKSFEKTCSPILSPTLGTKLCLSGMYLLLSTKGRSQSRHFAFQPLKKKAFKW